jgi:formate hydrogenlyase transcriptional activator
MDQVRDAELRATLNAIPAYAWYAAQSGGLTFVNERTANYLGLASDHPLRLGTAVAAASDSPLPLLHPDDHEETRRVWSACLSAGTAADMTFRVRSAEGRYRWFLSRAEPVRASDGTVLYWIGINFDIDERKHVEAELRRSKAYLADAQRLSRTGFVAMDARTRRIFWSEEAARIYGYPPGTEPTPDLILQRSHPDDVHLVKEALERAAHNGNDFDYEHRLLMPDGSVKYLHDRAHRVKDEAGTNEVVGAIVDITERKVAEAVIRGQDTELRDVIDSMPAIVWSARPDGANAYVNSRFVEYCGMRPEEIAGTGWHAATHPDDLDQHHAKWLACVASGEPLEDEVRFRRADGQYRWHLQRGVPLRDPAGRIVKWYGVLTDIEDRKRAEETIREQERELRQTLDLAPQIIGKLGPRRERLYANRATLAYYGRTLDEWLRGSFRSEVDPEDHDRFQAAADAALVSGSEFELELRLRNRDGHARWHLARYNPLRDDNGQVVRWYVACTDIDDRKRAEERLRQENVALREEIDKASMFEEIVGASPALAAVLSRVAKVAASDSTVLITGETGTGKELLARAIHRRSRRGSRAFVAVSCAAIPRDLIASELFGHEKGAFTGAIQRRLGRFELADGGTILLDEVGELSSDTQVALLRVLQEREFERIGGRDRIRVDVRVIAATNRDLSAAVADGTFRQDLFYRLNVFPLAMPPLRDRHQDIPMLVEYFIGRYARKAGRTFRRVSKRTLDRLRSYPWPGNVRELQNVIERSVIVSDTDEFTVDDSWLSATPRAENRLGLSGTLAAHEKAIVEEALRASGGRVFGPFGAAARLGIPRTTLESKIRTLRIDKRRFRGLMPKRS